MGSFQVVYNAGGTLDEVKKLKLIELLEQIDNIGNLENVQSVDLVDEVSNVSSVDGVDLVSTVTTVETVNKIRGFASHTQPFNQMWRYSIPALEKDPVTRGDFEFDITLPSSEVDILAITLTCSGYGENDHYDLFVNGVQWFDNWYCSEVKEGLFLGSSTYVYAAPPNSNIKLVFKNDSGTSKTIWFGVRMLVD